MDVIHTAIWVSDLEATKAFYIDALGLEHSWDFVGPDGATNYYVTGEADAEIQFKHDPDTETHVNPSGIDHIAVSVEDTDEVLDRMVTETGCQVIDGPTSVEAAGVRVAFIQDPDGYVVEIVGPQ